MKRQRIDEQQQIKEGSGSSPVSATVVTATLYTSPLERGGGIIGGLHHHHHQQQPSVNLPAYSSPSAVVTANNTSNNNSSVKVVGEGMQSGLYSAPTVSYGVMPAATAPHSGKSPATMQPLSSSVSSGGGGGGAGGNGGGVGSGHSQLRTAAAGSSPPTAPLQQQDMQQGLQQQQQPAPTSQQSPSNNFQRLKVEDALSYLDLVKFKFSTKPQVYNDFLDIMKEFKSQSIDTPGVIQRVSNLFRGFPDLIVGFNTFLPPGYKIEVQKSDQGYAFQVSVSMPSPTGNMPSDPQQKMIMRGSGTINTMGSSVPMPVIPPQQPPQQPQQQQAPPPPTLQQPPQQQCQPLPLTQHNSAPVAPQAAPTLPVVHHPSNYGSGAPNYNSLSISAAQAAVTQALQGHTDTPQNQPVQFNHAINYVNKIKNRFQDQPEKYKRFLDILHIYQKEQRTMKESSTTGSGGKHLTEQEVYSQVAKLFENQSDLLAEFGQFLPDATSQFNSQQQISDHSVVKKTPLKQPYHRDSIIDRPLHKPSHHVQGGVGSGGGGGAGIISIAGGGGSGNLGSVGGQQKRSPPYQLTMHRDAPPPKKQKIPASCRDVTLAEAGKYGSLNDFAFFDKVRKAMRTPEVYNNFLRCLNLFNQEIISKSELMMIVNPFLGKFPELMRWFRDFLGRNEVEPIPYNVARSERPQGETALEIDLTTAKRLGASYCVIPPAQEGLTCSGRTQLCKEVLNDQWVSFPTWSEDSTFVSSRKTQYEEYMYRCEDERFELDVVIETNASTIRVLEGVHKKLNRMNADEVAKFRLDDCLGGSSPTLHQRALKRIYGDKAHDIIDGLKRNPLVAVPVVLRRLKAKEEEWREAQKGFNKIWREQNEKYYLKSLDHQGINFKQTDVKALRSKSLFNEIETLFDERHEQNDEGGSEAIYGPHLILPYRDRTILDDAANLLIHHVKRQTGIQKGEKRRIKHLLRQFIPDLFFHPKQQLTDDEREDDDDKEDGDESPGSSPSTKGKSESSPGKSPARLDCSAPSSIGTGSATTVLAEVEIKSDPDGKDDDVKVPIHAQTSDPDEAYTLFIANNNWYIFMRLHAILCERLAKIYERAVILAAEESKSRTGRKESTAVALRLKPKPQIEIEDYYVAFLDMVKNLLDGNMDANTYEDTLREMFGIHAYTAFTLDKVVIYAVRQLQHCVTERTAIACTDLFFKEQKRCATGGPCGTAYKRQHLEMAYQRAGEKAVQEESCFKIYVYRKDCRMTIELLDTEAEDPKKVDDVKKWNNYKECYADIRGGNGGTNSGNGGGSGLDSSKPRSPVYLNRNLRMYKKRMGHFNNKSLVIGEKKNATNNQQQQQNESSSDDQQDKSVSMDCDDDNNATSDKKEQRENDKDQQQQRIKKNSGNGDQQDDLLKFNVMEELERKMNPMPERNHTNHPGYDVSDETECQFNSQGSKIIYTVNKDSYLYKISAFAKARKTHPEITKRLSLRFRSWLKHWASANISDVQQKQCIDWLMGRGEGVIPNRTRVLTDNDLARTPYISYNRYRVERLTAEDAT